MKFAHDELEEEQRGLARLPIFWEVPLYPLLLFATERRVGHDHIHPILFANFGELEA